MKTYCDICGNELNTDLEIKACLCQHCMDEFALTEDDLITDNDIDYMEDDFVE